MLMSFTHRSLSALAARFRSRKGDVAGAVGSALPANEAQFLAYSALARDQGFDRLLLYLTFDCDTDEDAAAALELEPWLRSLDIRTAYAVPGAQLERAAVSYKLLADAGAEFLNHGYRPHAEWRDDRYIPITFYDQLDIDEVESDIRRGHDAVVTIIGRAPRGFRAPHFGSFQASHQLDRIYRLARELGYLYCSTTLPQAALDHGPVIDRGGVYEIPLFGSSYSPTAILNSWTYLEDRISFRLGQQYFDLFRDTIAYMLDNKLPGILAYYVDPAHVIGQKPFLDAMEMIARLRIPSVTAEDLVRMFRRVRDGRGAFVSEQ